MLEGAVLVAVRKWVEDPDSPNGEDLNSQSFTDESGSPPIGHRTRDPDKHNLCGADKRSGGQCSNYAGYGTDHKGYGCCKYHGGSTPSHRKRAQRKMIEAAMATYGLPIETTAEEALTAEINRCAGHVAWLQGKVQDLSDRDLIFGVVEAKQLREFADLGEDAEVGEEARPLYEAVWRAGGHVWLQLYGDERDRLVKVCAIAIKAGLDERKVRLAERQGMQMSLVIREFVRQIGIPPERMPEVPAALRRALEHVVGGKGRVINGALGDTLAGGTEVPVYSVLDQPTSTP